VLKKKLDENNEEDKLNEIYQKCMKSEPNALSLEKIKKAGAFLWSFGSN